MPTYDYLCENCKHEWDVDQKMSDPKITECPQCHELKAKRLISGGTNFQLVSGGSGWAKNGYGGSQ